MPLQRTVAPTALPVTVAFVKAHTTIDHDASDSYLTSLLIPAAVDYCEKYLRRSLITQTWVKTLDAFPGPSLMGVPYGVDYSLPGHAILLEKPPVQSITSLKYIAMDGSLQTVAPYVPGNPLPSSGYNFVDLTYGGTVRIDDLGRITPVFGQIWPINLPQIGSVQVTYVTGYGVSDSAVPATIKHWIAQRVATLYANREQCVVGTRVTVEELPYVDRMLDGDVIEFF